MAAATPIELLAFNANYLSALQEGNPQTERHFFEYFTPLIRAKLRKHLRTPELIEEATQETFLRVLAALRSRNGVRHPERFGGFVHAVCRNVAMETWRAERRFVQLEEVGIEGLDHDTRVDGPFRSPHALAEADEARTRVRQILTELSDCDRHLLEALLLDEEDRMDVCLRMNVTRAHLRVLLHRAAQRFRALMLTPGSSPRRRPATLEKTKMRRPQKQVLIAIRSARARSPRYSNE